MTVCVITYLWDDPTRKHHDTIRYTADDVRLLKRMVDRHMTVPHEFAVVTDRPEEFSDIRAIPIDWTKHQPQSCFVRLMTFHPNGRAIFGADKVLQLDLDTVIVGNMDALVERTEDLVLWRNPSRIPYDNPVKKGRPHYNGSIILHRCGTMPDVWATFNPKLRTWRDDQWYFAEYLGPDVPYFDGERDGVYRLAREDTLGSGVDTVLPANARVVTFPGSDGKPTDPRVLARAPWIWEHRC